MTQIQQKNRKNQRQILSLRRRGEVEMGSIVLALVSLAVVGLVVALLVSVKYWDIRSGMHIGGSVDPVQQLQDVQEAMIPDVTEVVTGKEAVVFVGIWTSSKGESGEIGLVILGPLDISIPRNPNAYLFDPADYSCHCPAECEVTPGSGSSPVEVRLNSPPPSTDLHTLTQKTFFRQDTRLANNLSFRVSEKCLIGGGMIYSMELKKISQEQYDVIAGDFHRQMAERQPQVDALLAPSPHETLGYAAVFCGPWKKATLVGEVALAVTDYDDKTAELAGFLFDPADDTMRRPFTGHVQLTPAVKLTILPSQTEVIDGLTTRISITQKEFLSNFGRIGIELELYVNEDRLVSYTDFEMNLKRMRTAEEND